MGRTDLHTHTTFSDGANTPEDMALSALANGIEVLGFSDHSYTPFDLGYSMTPENEPAYRAEISRLKEKYNSSHFEIRLGIEQDFYSAPAWDGYDYVIGSVHYVEVSENPYVHTAGDGHFYASVDESEELFSLAIEQCFGGDVYAFAEAYYSTVARVVEQTRCNIIGHFDLFKKYNTDGRYFDENDDRYMAAVVKAADELLKTGASFEINRHCPGNRVYPSEHILRYLEMNGARFVQSSDAHSVAELVG